MAESHPSQGAASVDKEGRTDKSTECRYCDRDFDSYMARRKHEGISHDEPYQKEEVLRELYIGNQMSMADIAGKFGVKSSLIDYWLKKNGIETRDPHEAQESDIPNFKTQKRGHEWCSTSIDGTSLHVQIHRLLAVSEYGFESVCDKVVHHKNNIPWDNRPENLVLMTVREHAKHHYHDDHPVNN